MFFFWQSRWDSVISGHVHVVLQILQVIEEMRQNLDFDSASAPVILSSQQR